MDTDIRRRYESGELALEDIDLEDLDLWNEDCAGYFVIDEPEEGGVADDIP